MKNPIFFVLGLLITGYASLAISEWDKLYGTEDSKRFDSPIYSQDFNYHKDIQPLLDKRCVVCHACYDAPCQLKLSAYEGVTRGASKSYVYENPRLVAATPTRLFMDGQTNEQWRELGFYPVLNERRKNAEANINGSVMAQMLLQKQRHPLPNTTVLPESFDFQLHRDQQCTTLDDYPDYLEDYPLWGMPYGLPALASDEHKRLMRWISAGAPYSGDKPISKELKSRITQWERFFNQEPLKEQLMSRYLYEHLFLAHLYFEDNDTNPPRFFELVRSKTPAPKPINLIATRRPFDDPGVKRVYYRIRPLKTSPAFKAHLPFKLDQSRMKKWQRWFLEPDYKVTSLPSYDLATASNPFKTFEQLPTIARYRMMLDEAEFIIKGFIKGPVCRGNVALNVINDHFWVAFIAPNERTADLSNKFVKKNVNQLQLPAADSSNAGMLNWVNYSLKEKEYAEAKSLFLNKHVGKDVHINLDLLWDGDGENPNAALTIFRHFDSASVIKGLHGGKPQTMWVVTYPLFERIHYLLVAGYDVFGNVGHQLNTRIYMDFLRMEGEFNFLGFLPKATRKQVHQHWYRDSTNKVQSYIFEYAQKFEGNTSVPYKTMDPLQELYLLIQEKMAPLALPDHTLAQPGLSPNATEALQDLNNLQGQAISWLPPTSIIALSNKKHPTRYLSMLSNSAYSNIAHLFDEEDRRLPKEDTLTLLNGIVGAYPNALFEVPEEQLSDFAKAVSSLRSDKDYHQLLDRFGIRRNAANFWAYSDKLHLWFERNNPIQYGILDYNRLQNR